MRGLCEESVSLKDESRGRALVCGPDMGAAHQDLFLPGSLDRANFTSLVLGCIETKFCK